VSSWRHAIYTHLIKAWKKIQAWMGFKPIDFSNTGPVLHQLSYLGAGHFAVNHLISTCFACLCVKCLVIPPWMKSYFVLPFHVLLSHLTWP